MPVTINNNNNNNNNNIQNPKKARLFFGSKFFWRPK